MAEEGPPDQGFRVSLDPLGIVRLSWAPGLRVTGPLADAARAAVDELNGDLIRPLLVEMAGTDTPTREARGHFGRPGTVSRIALLGESVVDRVRASFAARIGRTASPVPTRFFTSEPAALSWFGMHGDVGTVRLPDGPKHGSPKTKGRAPP